MARKRRLASSNLSFHRGGESKFLVAERTKIESLDELDRLLSA